MGTLKQNYIIKNRVNEAQDTIQWFTSIFK